MDQRILFYSDSLTSHLYHCCFRARAEDLCALNEGGVNKEGRDQGAGGGHDRRGAPPGWRGY